MTVPDAPPPATPAWPEDSELSQATAPTPAPRGGIRAVDGNRAALTLLLVQNVVAGLMVSRGAPLGVTLLVAFLTVALIGWVAFRPALTSLLQDSRWRTPPPLGVTLAAFVLAFIASRALALAFISLFPESAAAMPQFLSKGADLWVLLVSAGLLVPFAEEVAFRGLMMRGHERAAGFMVAALTSTLAFSVAHGVPASIVGILPLAYVLARVAQHSGSLWSSVIIHALNNSLAVGLGAVFASNKLLNPDASMDLLKNEAMRLPLALGAALFGGVVLLVLHLWLTPKADPQVRSAPGSWLSLAYVVIVLFGLSAMLMSLPAVQQLLINLRGVMP